MGEKGASLLIDSKFYLLSMLSVYAVIIFLVLLLPLFMWRRYLRGKSMIYRFLFCVITQTCYLTNLVLLLGFFNIANKYTLIGGIIIEYLIIRWKTYGKFKPAKERVSFRTAKNRLAANGFREVTGWVRRKLLDAYMGLRGFRKWEIWGWCLRNWFSLAVLGAALVYNAAFINHNVLSVGHGYQFSDIPVHLSWVYGLEHGTLFIDGIYPFYMHCMIYLIRALSGIHIRECILYYGGFQTLLLMLTSYCFSRKLFCNKYLALMPTVLFSILLRQGRYGASLPQECGMFAAMCVGYFILEFMQSKRKPHNVESDTKRKKFFRIGQYLYRYHLTTDLLLVALSVTLVIGYHFYTAIATIFLVIGFGAAYLPKLWRKERWVPLMTAGIVGAMLAVIPFAACLAKGIPFQESMAWATSVITGETWVNNEESSYKDMFNDFAGNTDGSEQSAEETSAEEEPVKAKKSMAERAALLGQAVENSDVLMFGDGSAKLMILCMAICAVFAVLSLVIKPFREPAMSYLTLCVYGIAIMLLGQAELLDIIELFDNARASVFIQPFLVIIYTIPVDIALRTLSLVPLKIVKRTVSVLAVAAAAFAGYWCVDNGYLHNYFDLNAQYYNDCDYVLKHIRESFPEKSFNVISPTDDIYATVDEGFHTEISQMMHMVDGGEKEFVIPSEYCFFFVEKKVLQDYTYGSVMVNPEQADTNMLYRASSQDYYYQRLAIESKAYYWAQEMLRLYPNNFTVYFENDILVVYLLRQNTNYPFSLKIDYRSTLESLKTVEETGENDV